VAASSDRDKGLLAGLVSGAVLVMGATTVFAELQSALDRIWHVPPSQKPKGIFNTLRSRLLSFGLILGMVFLLMVSLAVSAAVAAFGAYASRMLPAGEALLQGLNFVVSLGATTLLFAMIYKLMPSVRIAWRDVWVGAGTTAVLFEIGKFLIGLYLGKSSMTETFAAAGSLVILIAWVYYAAQIFLLGAEFTKVYAQEHGSHAAQAAMEATKATAVTGTPADTEQVPAPVGATAVAVEPEEESAGPAVPLPKVSGAVRLEENRALLRSEEVRRDMLEPRAWWDKPGLEAAAAGASAVAGGVVVALLRRLLQHRRQRLA